MHERTALITATGECRSWCTEHRTATRPEDGYCLGIAPTPAGDLLLGDLDTGPAVFLWRLRDELTLAEAEAFFRAGLKLAEAARAAVAA